LFFILGGEIGHNAFVRRADFPFTAEAVQVPLLAGARLSSIAWYCAGE
jgi:hypothetical protein